MLTLAVGIGVNTARGGPTGPFYLVPGRPVFRASRLRPRQETVTASDSLSTSRTPNVLRFAMTCPLSGGFVRCALPAIHDSSKRHLR